MYETIFRHEMDIRNYHQNSTQESFLSAVNKKSPQANSSDYLGGASRQIWKPLHAIVLFTGLRK
ncbi:hypothetical protein SAMN05444162_4901 [Paenibacillaceae bacterium GAS479]|nr:hypothetical protein SAMN05444162_4901 [Paenibacillaceae bacterium GAS479]